LSGEIIEVNKPLFDDPSIINKDPYEKGWIVKLKISNKNELENLIRASEVKE
jgi:glycine cleavage system H protein